MVTDLRIERFTPAHLEALAQLHAAVYGQAPDRERLRRKYDTRSLGNEVIGHLAFDGDRPVAYYGVLPVTLVDGGRELLTAQSGDTMTDPEYQGRGLFSRLGAATYDLARAEGIAFVFGFPNANSYPGFVKRLGWSHRRTMRSYRGLVPTIPVALLATRAGVGGDRLRRIQRAVVRRTRLASPASEVRSSVTESGGSGVRRDDAYRRYKDADLLQFRQGSVQVYFRFDSAVSVADVVGPGGASARAAMARLRVIAALTGNAVIRYHVSPGSASDRLVAPSLTGRDGLPYGHVAFRDDVDPEQFDFTFYDYDTF